MKRGVARAAGVLGIGLASAALAQATVVTFSSGAEGWEGPQGVGGATTIEPNGGNPGARLRTVFNNFGIEFRTASNQGFLGDYSRFSSVTLSFDVKVDRVEFFGQQVSRPLLIDLRSTNQQGSGYPWNSVYFVVGTVDSRIDVAWVHHAVTIADTASATLPPGWGGYGDEDPVTYEPRLPPGVTFADVLAGVDVVAISTLEPGYFFGFTDFDVSVDNISINGTPRQIGCGPADIAGTGGVEGPDGELNNNDFVVFIDWFFGHDVRADRGSTGGVPGSDGALNNNDFVVFIDQFFAGC